MSDANTNKKEQWDYIFKVFPIVDLPFNILAIYLSQNWVFSLIIALIFPVVASTIIYFSEKRNFYPGPGILAVNGSLFILYVFVSGPNSPTWLTLINITVGSSFMFKNPRVGQYLLVGMALITGFVFYFIGATWMYSLTIISVILGMILLFSRAYDYLQFQQSKIEDKNKEIESKNKDITDSINYAKRIQYAVLPQEETIYRSIPLSFVYYKPKDIVSGDFFWFHEISRDEYILVCADCTGHGVPGAFMTVIGSNLLNQTVIDNKITRPSIILEELDKQINFTLKQQKENNISVQDGMDLTLMKVNKAKNELILAGAKRPVVFIRDKVMQEIRGSKYSLGGMRSGEKIFEEVKLSFKEEDCIYLYTDGYADQFGGERGKKYSSKRLKETILSVHKLPVNEQKNQLSQSIEKWMGELEQVDDILMIGIKF